MSAARFEWARTCIERALAAAGLHASLGETAAGAPYARLAAHDEEHQLPMTLQLAEDTLVVTADIGQRAHDPTTEELGRLDEIARRWPRGSLAWDTCTRTLLARAYLDAPTGEPPLGSDLRVEIGQLLTDAPYLADLTPPPPPRDDDANATSLEDIGRRFADAGLALVPLDDAVLGQRVRHPLPTIGSFGFAAGLLAEWPGFFLESELLDGTRWSERDAGRLANELRDALGLGTIILRDGVAVWRACCRRLPDDPQWPRRAVDAAASAVRDIAAIATTGRFDRRPPRPA